MFHGSTSKKPKRRYVFCGKLFFVGSKDPTEQLRERIPLLTYNASRMMQNFNGLNRLNIVLHFTGLNSLNIVLHFR